MMAVFTTVLLLCTAAWATRPEGVLTGHPWAKAAQEAIDGERFDEALVLLRVDLKTPQDFIWNDYLRGQAMIGLGKLDSADALFGAARTKCLEIADAAERGRLESRVMRKQGLALRERLDYDGSRKLHFEALDLAQRYGSLEEEHDCLISIDVDCWHMQDWAESERILRQSLETAAQITEPMARTRAQATSQNNLAGTLAKLHNFEEAVERGQTALTLWGEWEAMTGNHGDFRVGWAHYGLADIYIMWAGTMQDALEASNKRGMAKYELMIAHVIGRDTGQPQKIFDEIDRRMVECQ